MGIDPEPTARRWVRRHQWAEKTQSRPSDLLGRAGLVVLCPPTQLLPMTLAAVAPHLRRGSVVTTVAGELVRPGQYLDEQLPNCVYGVAGHPMAGKETAGAKNASPDLFSGAAWAIARSRRPAAKGAVQTVRELATCVGARPIAVDSFAHDQAMTAVSHLPYLVSVALASAVSRIVADIPAAALLAGPGLRDATRLCASPTWTVDALLAAPEEASRLTTQAFETAWKEVHAAVWEGDRDRLVAIAQTAAEGRMRVVKPSAPAYTGADHQS